jgi:hypothetical protein
VPSDPTPRTPAERDRIHAQADRPTPPPETGERDRAIKAVVPILDEIAGLAADGKLDERDAFADARWIVDTVHASTAGGEPAASVAQRDTGTTADRASSDAPAKDAHPPADPAPLSGEQSHDGLTVRLQRKADDLRHLARVHTVNRPMLTVEALRTLANLFDDARSELASERGKTKVATTALAFYGNRRQWLNDCSVKVFPGVHGAVIAENALKDLASLEAGEPEPSSKSDPSSSKSLDQYRLAKAAPSPVGERERPKHLPANPRQAWACAGCGEPFPLDSMPDRCPACDESCGVKQRWMTNAEVKSFRPSPVPVEGERPERVEWSGEGDDEGEKRLLVEADGLLRVTAPTGRFYSLTDAGRHGLAFRLPPEVRRQIIALWSPPSNREALIERAATIIAERFGGWVAPDHVDADEPSGWESDEIQARELRWAESLVVELFNLAGVVPSGPEPFTADELRQIANAFGGLGGGRSVGHEVNFTPENLASYRAIAEKAKRRAAASSGLPVEPSDARAVELIDALDRDAEQYVTFTDAWRNLTAEQQVEGARGWLRRVDSQSEGEDGGYWTVEAARLIASDEGKVYDEQAEEEKCKLRGKAVRAIQDAADSARVGRLARHVEAAAAEVATWPEGMQRAAKGRYVAGDETSEWWKSLTDAEQLVHMTSARDAAVTRAQEVGRRVGEYEKAIDDALTTTWQQNDDGWGTDEDTLHPDRLTALAALQPHWLEWGDRAWGLAGKAIEVQLREVRSAFKSSMDTMTEINRAIVGFPGDTTVDAVRALVAEVERLRASKPLSTDLLRNPPDELFEHIAGKFSFARATACAYLTRVADWVDKQHPSSSLDEQSDDGRPKHDRPAVISALREMRQTHVDWMEHFSSDGGKTEIACTECPPNIRETVGDYDHHGACVEFYDAAIAMLSEPSPAVGLTVEEAEAALQVIGSPHAEWHGWLGDTPARIESARTKLRAVSGGPEPAASDDAIEHHRDMVEHHTASTGEEG